MAFRTFETEEEFQAAAAEVQKQGAEAERIRIAAIEAVPMARFYPDVVNALKADGKSTAADAALAILTADEKFRHQRGLDIKADAPAPVNASEPDPASDARIAGKTNSEHTQAEFSAQIRNRQAKAKAEGRTLTPAQAMAEIQAGTT